MLKIAYPDRVFVNRGNHEDSILLKNYGTLTELHRLYGIDEGSELYDEISEFLPCLPIGCVINDKIIALHGGITKDMIIEKWTKHRGDSRKLWKTTTLSTVPLDIVQCLWGDPFSEEKKKFPRHTKSIIFSEQDTLEFLEKNHLCKNCFFIVSVSWDY